MGITEVFKNPTVKTVIFQIRFPNLFFIESKIGEYQMKIIKDFPESSLLFKKPLVLLDPSQPYIIEDASKGVESTQKIWQFKGSNNYTLGITSNSLDISSEFHKTYNNSASEFKFRDIIRACVDPFLKITSLPTISRIGLRYIDECPLPEYISNSNFLEFYNSTLPISRFDLEKSKYYESKIETVVGENILRYAELLNLTSTPSNFIIDMDGFRFNVKSDNYLSITDELHDLIAEEYDKTISEKVKDIMRK